MASLRSGKWQGSGQAGQQLACVLDSHVTLPEVKDESNCPEIREFSSGFGPERSSSLHQPLTLNSNSRLLRQARYRLSIPNSTSTGRSLKLHQLYIVVTIGNQGKVIHWIPSQLQSRTRSPFHCSPDIILTNRYCSLTSYYIFLITVLVCYFKRTN